MKREICVPEVPASQTVLVIITDEQLEAFADAVITKYQQNIARRTTSIPKGAYRYDKNSIFCPTIRIITNAGKSHEERRSLHFG